MIPVTNRFRGQKSLNLAYRYGQTVRANFVALRIAHNPQTPTYRLAVVVSKKVAKHAVDRNRIRRRLFEAFRERADSLPPHSDMILTVFAPQLTDVPAEELAAIVEGVIESARAEARRTGGHAPQSHAARHHRSH